MVTCRCWRGQKERDRDYRRAQNANCFDPPHSLLARRSSLKTRDRNFGPLDAHSESLVRFGIVLYDNYALYALRPVHALLSTEAYQIKWCASEICAKSLILLVGPGGLEPPTRRL